MSSLSLQLLLLIDFNIYFFVGMTFFVVFRFPDIAAQITMILNFNIPHSRLIGM